MHSIEIFLVLDFIFDLIFSLYFLATIKKHFQNANKKEEIQGKEQKYCRVPRARGADLNFVPCVSVSICNVIPRE